MSRPANSFSRRGAVYAPQPTVLVLCEDLKSSKSYLESLAKHHRAIVKVVFDHCGNTDPLGIVREAKRCKGNYEQVYCVIDRDTHHNFDQAIDYAKAVGVNMVVSYPCFEFWLLLHFGYNRRPYMASGSRSAGDQVVAELRRSPGMHNYQKGSKTDWFAFLLDRYETAKRNAARSLQDAQRDEEPNPSTELHNLILVIEELSQPKPLV